MKFSKKRIFKFVVCDFEGVFVNLVCIFQSMCFQFINALLSQTDDFEFRMHLRNEIVRNGLYDSLGESKIGENFDYFWVVFSWVKKWN